MGHGSFESDLHLAPKWHFFRLYLGFGVQVAAYTMVNETELRERNQKDPTV